MDEIEQLCEVLGKGTAGPWYVDGCGDVFGPDEKVFKIDDDPDERIGTTPKWSDGNPNARSIVLLNNIAEEVLHLVEKIDAFDDVVNEFGIEKPEYIGESYQLVHDALYALRAKIREELK